MNFRSDEGVKNLLVRLAFSFSTTIIRVLFGAELDNSFQTIKLLLVLEQDESAGEDVLVALRRLKDSLMRVFLHLELKPSDNLCIVTQWVSNHYFGALEDLKS